MGSKKASASQTASAVCLAVGNESPQTHTATGHRTCDRDSCTLHSQDFELGRRSTRGTGGVATVPSVLA